MKTTEAIITAPNFFLGVQDDLIEPSGYLLNLGAEFFNNRLLREYWLPIAEARTVPDLRLLIAKKLPFFLLEQKVLIAFVFSKIPQHIDFKNRMIEEFVDGYYERAQAGIEAKRGQLEGQALDNVDYMAFTKARIILNTLTLRSSPQLVSSPRKFRDLVKYDLASARFDLLTQSAFLATCEPGLKVDPFVFKRLARLAADACDSYLKAATEAGLWVIG